VGREVEVEVALPDGQAVLAKARAGDPGGRGAARCQRAQAAVLDVVTEALHAVGTLEHPRHEQTSVAFG
jgi:hypothetical protein